MAKGAIVTKGLSELVVAFRVANKEVAKDVRAAIATAGQPIADEAALLAHSQISGMARSRIAWYSMRTGIIGNTVGYIAPATRGGRFGRKSRPKLAPKLAEKEQTALEHNRDRVLDEFNDAMEQVARAWARV